MESPTRTAGREGNPLWNDNKMKLGIFGANVSNGCAMTMAEGRLETSWPNTKLISTMADRAGFEAMVGLLPAALEDARRRASSATFQPCSREISATSRNKPLSLCKSVSRLRRRG